MSLTISSSLALRSTSVLPRQSSPSYSKRSYAKKAMGASCNCFLVIFFLPMRVCNKANGKGLPSTTGIISPSKTIPSGKRSCKRVIFRKFFRHQSFSPAPYKQFIISFYDLSAYSIPFPFYLPFISIS